MHSPRGRFALSLEVICVLLLLAKNSESQSLKGGSDTHYSRFSSHSGSQASSSGLQSACGHLDSPRNGNARCQNRNNNHTCTATCLSGDSFPSGEHQIVLVCIQETGQWSPYSHFPDCPGSYGNSEHTNGGYYSESSFSSSRGSSHGQSKYEQGGGCISPNAFMNGKFSCSSRNGQKTCKGECFAGNHFPDGSSEMTITCSNADGHWAPKDSFEDCVGGSYSHSSYSQSSSSSGSSQYGHGQGRYQQGRGEGLCVTPTAFMNGRFSCSMANGVWTCKGSCNPGSHFPDGSSDLTLTCNDADGHWSPKPTFDDCEGSSSQSGYRKSSSSSVYSEQYGHGGYNQGQGQGLCVTPTAFMNGRFSCSMVNGVWTCKGSCNPGSHFPDGSSDLTLTCNDADGRWSPKSTFDDCEGSSSQSGYRKSSSSSVYSQQYDHGGYNQGHGQGLCVTPTAFMNGRFSCSMMNGVWTCKGSCNPGGHFPDGSGELTLTCNDADGRWSPKSTFDDCEGGSGGGYGSSSSHYGSYGQTSHQASSSQKGSSSGYGTGQQYGGGTGLCVQPSSPKNAAVDCQTYNGEMSCRVLCNGGYEFPDRTRELHIKCNERDGHWLPTGSLQDCSPQCNPHCQNGGTCISPMVCVCPETHRGNACQYAISLCDGHRFLGGRNVEFPCDHTEGYTECHASCPPGMTFDPHSLGLYRCTVLGEWNPPQPPNCKGESMCHQPPSPKNGRIECNGNSEIMQCTATCRAGHTFDDHSQKLTTQCVKHTGQWSPRLGFPDCQPICSPECLNGGRCIGHNKCLCTSEYRGTNCEYSLANCDAKSHLSSVAYSCSMDASETACEVHCQGASLVPPYPTRYVCALDGTWTPPDKPHCDYGHGTSHHIEGSHTQGQSWSSSHSSSSNSGYGEETRSQGSYREDSGHGYGSNSGQSFEGQERMEDGEFMRQETIQRYSQQQQNDYDSSNQMFDGQQQENHEFNQQSGQEINEDSGSRSQNYIEGEDGSSNKFSQSRREQGLEDFDIDLSGGHRTKGGSVKGGYEKEYEGEDVEIIEIENEVWYMKKDRASAFSGICSTWGFYHMRTFDGNVFTYPSTCWYTLAASLSEDGIAIAAKADCSNGTCFRSVAVKTQMDRYLISYQKGLSRNGVSLTIPIQDGDLVVEYLGRYLAVKTTNGYDIWLNEEGGILIAAETYLKDHTKGLCGKYNSKAELMFVTSDGERTNDIAALVSSWKDEDIEGECVDGADTREPCRSDSKEMRLIANVANIRCASILDVQFNPCAQVMDLRTYFAKCQMDCCSMAAEDCECTSLAEMVMECSRAGVDMDKGWRQSHFCPLGCSKGAVYKQCGSPCPPTCADQEPTCPREQCVDGCYCPDGMVLDAGQCIELLSCPCQHGDQVYQSGETMEQDCNQCICEGGKWQCTEAICSATCSLVGPHMTTFDGLSYDLVARCPHTAVDGDGFQVLVDYKERCGRGSVCVKSVTIHTQEGAIVKMKPSMEVTVNGREIIDLPVIAPGVYVGQATSTYMRAHLKNGLDILWDTESTVHIEAPSELFGAVKGLCGTFSKSRLDDFSTPEGDVEAAVEAFAEKWRADETCDAPMAVAVGDVCDASPKRRSKAEEACRIIKEEEFEECHDLLDYGRYLQNCLQDACACDTEPAECACATLASYAAACARKGKPIAWRQTVRACGIACPHGQVYHPCTSPCSYSCGEIAHSAGPGSCREGVCAEGCVCPPGHSLDHRGQCVPLGECSCLHSGHAYPPDFVQRRGKDMCECSSGNWECHEASVAEMRMTPAPPVLTTECKGDHMLATDCALECPLTCANYHHHKPCTTAICAPGCKCELGFVFDALSGNCVRPHQCPCHHAGMNYAEGEEVTMGCNKCRCSGGGWKCDGASCTGVCSAWGDSHFETFDGRLFDFEGSCDYVMLRAKTADGRPLSVVLHSQPCGGGGAVPCGKTVTVTLGDSSIVLTRTYPLPTVAKGSNLSTSAVGMFTLVESDVGITVQWDRKTRVYITAQPIFRNKLQGLCGDFNSDASDDFRPPSGGVPLVLSKDFADSWRVHKFCRPASQAADSCEDNPERRAWSRQKCAVLKSDLFKPCHYQVEVEEYYKRCVLDACACNSGGDCDCLCAVVSAYSQKCARNGVPISWRSQELCPVQCEACDHYSPCISLCPPPNCDNPDQPPSCSREHCVDGCEPKPCPQGFVHASASNFSCVPEAKCSTQQKPCIVLEGVSYKEGERVKSKEYGDACQSCHCRGGIVQCVGVPCAPPTVLPLVTEPTPECQFTGWSSWINSFSPDDLNGDDKESLEDLASEQRLLCPLEHIKSVQCRSVLTQEPSDVTGQNLVCDLQEGLVCSASNNQEQCHDFEIRVYCQCHEEESPCPPGQQWDECAFECDQTCHSLRSQLQAAGSCKPAAGASGRKGSAKQCAAGCLDRHCRRPLVARDAETCVMPEMCTCTLDSGYVLAPGEVVTNGCEKCQCFDNSLICSTIVECKVPEETQQPFEEIPTTTSEYETFTMAKVTPRMLVEESTRGVVLTTPACSFWSDWVNKGRPQKGNGRGETEGTTPSVLRQSQGFCMKGSITGIECHEAKTGVDYLETEDEQLVCSLDEGFRCLNDNQPDQRCEDYKIRYFCDCEEATTPVAIYLKSTTPIYVYPCSHFGLLLSGPDALDEARIKASSSYSPASGPDQARFSTTGKGVPKSWTAASTDEKQFIEVDLNDVHAIYGIVTRGKEYSDEWVTSYQLMYSYDGFSYAYYQDENENNKVFTGNFDDSSEVRHVFERPFEARFVRLQPLTWETEISLKLDLLGCAEEGDVYETTISTTEVEQVCKELVGIQDGALLDSQFSASSSYNRSYGAEKARLGLGKAWVAAQADDKQYLQLDFIEEATITGVLSKGREEIPQWVTSYAVSHSKDGDIWTYIKDFDGSEKEFPANYDPYAVVTNDFLSPVRARYLRIVPKNWKNWISMQIDLLGCLSPSECLDPLGIADGRITKHQLSATSAQSAAHGPSNIQLTSLTSWTPDKYDKGQFLQIDLLVPLEVRGIIAKGDPVEQQWLKSYYVGYSDDGTTWKKIENEQGKFKEFMGNTDQDSAVINLFDDSVKARYFRVIPLKWHRWTSVRLELIGCFEEQQCREPMGVENGLVSDGQIAVSSSLDEDSSHEHARLGDWHGWQADDDDHSPFVQVDFLEAQNVSAVVTKGIVEGESWVTTYKVLTSDDADKWLPITDDAGDVVVFKGNTDEDSPVVNTFPNTEQARFFRIVPLSHEHNVGLRFELLGCFHPHVCQEPLGMESGKILDFQITASSQNSPQLGVTRARPDSLSGWVPEPADDEPYIQVDFMVPSNITGLMILGRKDAEEWITTYKVVVSDDGHKWTALKEDNRVVVPEFQGNSENDSPVTNLFPTPVTTRFLRIKPMEFKEQVAMRFEVIGCPITTVCLEPMGITNGLLSDAHISASSYKSEETRPPEARFNSQFGWMPETLEKPLFLQINFGDKRRISAVVTKGSGIEPSWVTSYQVAYSADGDHWTTIEDKRGDIIEFEGNFDKTTPVINVFPETIEVQAVKVIPTDWNNWVGLKVEILGCYHPYPEIGELKEPYVTVPVTTEGGQVTHMNIFSSPNEFTTEPTMVTRCPDPMEHEFSLLKESSVRASSGDASRLPLNTKASFSKKGGSSAPGGWVPASSDRSPYLLLELPDDVVITALYTQGRDDADAWVKTVRVLASTDNVSWQPVFGPKGNEILMGNEDRTSVVGHYFKQPVSAKYVKIVPETYHNWPSFRMDLKGCHLQKEQVPQEIRQLELCPGLMSWSELVTDCPRVCQPGLVCDGEGCIDPLDCPCVHDGSLFKVGDKLEDDSCMQCDCALGGHAVCTKKVCPPCPQHERSVLQEDCVCTCKGCREGEAVCPSSQECVPRERWCDGVVDCPDDETNCLDNPPVTVEPIIPPPPRKAVTVASVPMKLPKLSIKPARPIKRPGHIKSPPRRIAFPTPHLRPENATCDVMGKHIQTFDGQEIEYEICHHVVMKDIVNEVFNISLHKKCGLTEDCKHWLELNHKDQNVKIFSDDLRVEYNGHIYTPSQLSVLNKNSPVKDLVIERVGDQVSVKSLRKNYEVVYDNVGHLKIEVAPSLKEKVGGLCGYYSGEMFEDQKKPNGKLAKTSQEFGDSWNADEDGRECQSPVCPHDVLVRAVELCNKLKEDPFDTCSGELDVSSFEEFCVSSSCECLLQEHNTEEKCRCASLEPFAEACEQKLGPTAIRNWRFKHGCHVTCPEGMEWQDCGPSCQLTCERSTLDDCSPKCVPGCFCPPGTVLHDDKCIAPTRCDDQTCQGFGDPHFTTFDDLFYPFQAEGTFLIVGDDRNDFELSGYSKQCNLLTTTTCLTGLRVVFRGHEVVMKKKQNVSVDGLEIPTDKLPLYAHDMIVLGYPGGTFVVSIPQISLEARYYEDNSGFSVKVPSLAYYNRTRGLCGNCNKKRDDELKDKPLSEFVCSYQTEGDPEECKRTMENLPKVPARVPLCDRLESSVFGACRPLVGPGVFVEACTMDAAGGRHSEALCKTATEYARQCCQVGVVVEGWMAELGCDDKCPEHLHFKQCHSGCPQTCESLKDNADNSVCSQIKLDGCFCPEGKVLKGEECIDPILCETCDEEGHVVGDSWQDGKCKRCHCDGDAKVECVVEVCPPKPVCSVHESLAKEASDDEEPCCERYSCVAQKRNCPEVDIPKCPDGEVAKTRTRSDLCTEYECECDPLLCPAIVWPSDLEDGQIAEMVNDSCCPKMKVICNRRSCPDKPDCNRGLELLEIEGDCCISYKCKPPPDVCVYTMKYEVFDGLQFPMKAASLKKYKPGEEWEDGLCEKCKCTGTDGQFSPLCEKEQCSQMENMAESKDYVLHEVDIPGKCCPEVFRSQCKDADGYPYQEGESWSDYDDPCTSYVCETAGVGEVQKIKSKINCTECPKTAEYFAPSKALGQCCGICRVTKCESGGQLYEIGQTWTPEDQPCRKAECVNEYGIVKTIYTLQRCPVIPKDCPKTQIIRDVKDCCDICNLTSEISCSSGPIPAEKTVGLFKFRDDSHGGFCKNMEAVPNVLKCSGACHSESYYSMEDGDFSENCKCCKVNITVDRTIELLCPDNQKIRKSFTQPQTCQCSKCAPKGPKTNTVKTKTNLSKTNRWSQQPEKEENWGAFGQRPIDTGNRFEPLRESQQERIDDTFGQMGEVQQESRDYGFSQQAIQQETNDYDDMELSQRPHQESENHKEFENFQQKNYGDSETLQNLEGFGQQEQMDDEAHWT